MPKSVLVKVCAVRDELNANFLERETVIDAALMALVTKSHMLMLGPPGTAKSMLVRAVCERIDGSTYFEKLLTKFSTPEELFGPLSLSALEQDKYQRITGGTIVEAQISFLDEVFKANSAILNSLLTLVNERVYQESGQVRPVPLLSLFGASNETPEDDSLTALHDRFLLRVTVPSLADDESMRKLFCIKPTEPSEKLTYRQLTDAQEQVDAVELTDQAVEAIITIKHELESEGVAASDRRWQACANLVKACAWLEGESTTSDEHCEVLSHALWSEPSQIRVVERCVAKVASPLNLEAVELEDAAKDLYDQRPSPEDENLTQALEPLLKQVKDIHTRLDSRISAANEKRTLRARQALNKIEAWHQELSGLAFKSLSKLHVAPGA